LERVNIDRDPGRIITIIAVPAPFEMDRQNPEIIGKIVEFELEDGWFIVTGVERNLPAGPIREGEIIGVTVDPLVAVA
jgi:hypothetical protein